MSAENTTRVLIVDDDSSTCRLIEGALAKHGFAVSAKNDPDDAVDLLLSEDFDVVVSDLLMEPTSGVELCRHVTENRPDIPVIIMTGFGSMESVTEAIRAGAYDYVTKPFEVEVLRLAIDRAMRHRRLRAEVTRLKSEARAQPFYEGMIGRSRAMRLMYELISRSAPSEATIMITGESGTGKERVARAIHAESRRASGPFVAVNCAAMPETLLESELFGHARGAFTDAKTSREGLFVAASGTLFLDEIGDMPLSMQVKLLRALQERRVRPLGEAEERPFDTRLITATNRDIDSDVEEGRFRADLFYRLNVVRIAVPALRQRGNDVLLLAQHFLGRAARRHDREVTGLSRAAAEKLMSYPFPGNVRELENVIERAVALAKSSELQLEDLPEKVAAHERPPRMIEVDNVKDLITAEELERRYIAQVLESVGGNRTQASKILRMDRKTLYRKLHRWGMSSRATAMRGG